MHVCRIEEAKEPFIVGYDLRAAGEEITIGFLTRGSLDFDFGIGFLVSCLPTHVGEVSMENLSLTVILLNIELPFMTSFVDETSCMFSRCSRY